MVVKDDVAILRNSDQTNRILSQQSVISRFNMIMLIGKDDWNYFLAGGSVAVGGGGGPFLSKSST